MKNKQFWKPTKFIVTKHGCMASRDVSEVGIGSRFSADILANVYEKTLKEHAKGVLLDLGCGDVPLLEIYNNYISDNICIDWKNSHHKNPFIDYEFDLNNKIPLPDEQFDTILITDVLEHISNPDLFWREISRLLKPKGKLILGVPFFYWIHEPPFDYYRYTEYKLRMFCSSNGLTILCLKSYGGSPEVMLDLIAKHIDFSKTLSTIFYFLSNIFMSSFIGKILSKKTSQKFPLGYYLIAQK